MPVTYLFCNNGCYKKAIAAYPAARAVAQLTSFAQKKLFLLSAKSGMDACPSCEMLFASKTGRGTIPAA